MASITKFCLVVVLFSILISLVYASAITRTISKREIISLYNEKEEFITSTISPYLNDNRDTTAELPTWFITLIIITGFGNLILLLLVCYCCLRTWPLPLRFVQMDIQSFLYGQFSRVHNDRNMQADDQYTAQQATEMNRYLPPLSDVVELSSVTT